MTNELMNELRRRMDGALEALRLIPDAPEGLRDAVAGISEPGQLADVLASFEPEEVQAALKRVVLA